MQKQYVLFQPVISLASQQTSEKRSWEWEPGREEQSKSNSLRSRQAPTPFFPGVRLSMKNNVCSSRNKISGPCLMLDLESRGPSVPSAPRWHRHHQLFLLVSNLLTENTLKPVAVCAAYFMWKEESFSHFQLLFKVHHKARKSEGNETMFPAHNHCMQAKNK